jgi:alpha-soluble NSF attachment protein
LTYCVYLLAGNKNEEAAELLEKAANYYKLGKAWREATEAYRQLAAIQIKQDSKHDAANAYVEGAKCAMKVQPQDAVVLLQSAVELYTEMGRLNMAARQLREIAEAQEKQGLKEEALQFYLQAADLFATENATSDANKARIKVAELSAEMDRYQVKGGQHKHLDLTPAGGYRPRSSSVLCTTISAAEQTAFILQCYWL